MIDASFAGGTQLMQYVDLGILVIAPNVSETQQVAQEEEATSNLFTTRKCRQCFDYDFY